MTAAALISTRLGPEWLVAGTRDVDGEILRVDVQRLGGVVRFLRDDPDAGFDRLVDVTAIDHGPASTRQPNHATRFELLVVLYARRARTTLRVVAALDDEEPRYESLTALWPGATLLERELCEMFGVVAEGHPGLEPLLLWSGFVGHPLRRDYRIDKAQPRVALRAMDDDKQPRVEADVSRADGRPQEPR